MTRCVCIGFCRLSSWGMQGISLIKVLFCFLVFQVTDCIGNVKGGFQFSLLPDCLFKGSFN